MKNKKSIFAWLVTFAMVLALAIGGMVGAVAYADPPETLPDPLPEIRDVAISEEGLLTWDYGGQEGDWFPPEGIQYGYYVEIYDSTNHFLTGEYNQPTNHSYNVKDALKAEHVSTGTYTIKLEYFAYDEEEAVDYDYAFTQQASIDYEYTNEQTPLPAPTDLQITDATISWTAVAGAVSYTYQVYEDGVAKPNLKGTVNTTSKQLVYGFDIGHTYYFTVRANAGSTDLEHTHSAPAQSAQFSFNRVSNFSNLTIALNDANHWILNFDGFTEEQAYIVGVTFSQNGTRISQGYHTLPYDITYYNGAYLSSSQDYTIEITVYDANYTPLNKYVIEGYSYGDTYTQPVQPANNGLGAGAIIAIVLAVVIVGGCGGFALVWFVIKKKSWADFTALFSKKPAVAGAEPAKAEEAKAEPAEEKADRE